MSQAGGVHAHTSSITAVGACITAVGACVSTIVRRCWVPHHLHEMVSEAGSSCCVRWLA